MNNQSPPQLPPGWIALWDESAQLYYYVEQATGTTQWEVPTQSNTNQVGVVSRGEAASYSNIPQGGYLQQGGYPQQSSCYPQQDNYSHHSNSGKPQPGVGYPQNDTGYSQQISQQSNVYPQQSHQQSNSSYSQQGSISGYPDPTNAQKAQTADGPDGERGIGKMLSGFGGGALTGTLIGLAAGKLLGNNHHSHHQHSGGFAQQFGNFGTPPQGQAPQGYYPPPPQNYGQPPKKHHFW